MNLPRLPHVPRLNSRRDFLFKAGGGFGALALAALLRAEEDRGEKPHGSPLTPKKPQFETKAKNVIFLFMEGGPSHLDTFDPKPELNRRAGQKLPDSFGPVITPMGTGGNTLLAPKRKWQKYGRSGLDVSDWLPHIATCADDLAVVRSCWADGLNHVGSVCQMNTGSILAGRPSLGAWTLYGLGSDNQNLPGFVVMSDAGEPTGGARNWGTGFMPATYQGTFFRGGSHPILNLASPDGVGPKQQEYKLELIERLNKLHQESRPDDSDLAARINAYELAYRMQAAAPDVVDLAKEPDRVKEMYGLDRKECADFAHRCLLARRLVERGVRFVQIYCGGGSQWDAHSDIEGNHSKMCARCDQPTAALLKDLKQRGLLDSTLVIWCGEFGRTPMVELRGTTDQSKAGRDHHPMAYSLWLSGGGVRGGQVIGKTDDLCMSIVEDPVHVHDLQATILHLLGFDHTRLTYRHLGRDFRLTDVGGKVVTKLSA